MLILLGIVIGGGGIWLLLLGGTWYYLVAGIGLIVSGALMMRHEMTSVWVYLVTWLITLGWAYAEVQFDGWALVPRLVAPTIVLIVVLLTIPALGRGRRRSGTAAGAVGAAVLLVAAGGFLAHNAAPVAAFAQNQPADQPPVTEPAQNPAATPATPPAPATPAPAQQAAGAAPSDMATIQATGAKVPTKPGQVLKAGEDWPVYGGSDHETRFSPLDQITPQNASKLTKVWTYHTGDMPDKKTKDKYSPENTPIKIGRHLFMCSAMDIMISVDAVTGKEVWRHDPKVPDAAVPYGATCRGVAYYKVPNVPDDQLCATRIIEGTMDARLIAVDAKTGKPCADFGEKGSVDLMKGIGESVPGWYGENAPPVIVRGIVVVGGQVKDGEAEDAPSGVIRGYDAVTGKLAWAWDMGHPNRVGAPPEGQTYTRGTPNMWTAAAADPELGYVYIPLGNSAVDYYGGNRKRFENEFSSSVVAIDVTTGKPVWHFQTVHYDVWDYDLGSQPSLVDLPTDNGTVPALILPSKTGQIYVLNRKTGKPLFPVEERKVPTGGVEPQNLSPTQPYSTYAHLDEPRLKETDMWGMTPIDQLWCRIQFHRVAYKGEYTPPTSDKPFLEYPSYNGGSDWGSVAVDTKRGILVANYNDMANFDRLIPRKQADKMGLKPIDKRPADATPREGYSPQAGSPYAIYINAGWRLPTGLMCTEPPYGHIRAIDLKTGKTLWDQPLGDARENGPWGIGSALPVRIGTPNNGGPLVTAGGLIFIAATTDDMFRAIDIKTGKVVWQTQLPAGGQTNPMTYSVDGRQYVVIAPGGHHFMHTPVGDEVIAYALPKQ